MNKTTPKIKNRTITWKVELQKKKLSRILSQMLFKIIPFQINSEKPILKLNAGDLNLNIQYAPLTTRTSGLEPKNSYFSDIRLLWKLKWTRQVSIFQKIFMLKHLKILNEFVPLKCLEDATE